jgi:hypothetical protein
MLQADLVSHGRSSNVRIPPSQSLWTSTAVLRRHYIEST